MKLPLLLLTFLMPSLTAHCTDLAPVAAPLKRVAFVFDDGPDPAQTPALLRVLEQAGAKVSFSYVGQAVAAHPALARAAADAGHEINNHSFSHPHLRTLDDAAVRSELSRTSAAIKEATGREPSWFWAPYLETDERIAALALDARLVHFPYPDFHFISTSDWDAAHTDAAAIHRAATTDVRDRTVILFHEWRAETVAQMPAILAELRRQGCTFVTFTELATAGPAK